ncbi:dTDP-4-dehydrorhamnose reductase [Syntrophobacter sp. SbD1]|nr:dTDP-4-dehydrorhamnose reductase [Syntrophobacter sp. SbD1]
MDADGENVVVVGSGGMLGWEVVELLKKSGFTVTALDIPEIDITKPQSVHSVLGLIKGLRLLINCAAYTAVDKAESESEAAFAANRDGPANLADECARFGIPIIHISTDYIFNGMADRPYKEENAADPINIYGLSKWQGEEAVRSRISEHVIVRTSWLYGARGQNFVKTMLRLGAEREELKVVSDQYGCPTWSFDLAACLVRIAERAILSSEKVPWGAYHFCGAGITTWYNFASAILDEARRRQSSRIAKVMPVPTSSYPTVAARPMYSALDCSKIEASFGIAPPPWEKSLAHLMDILSQGI